MRVVHLAFPNAAVDASTMHSKISSWKICMPSPDERQEEVYEARFVRCYATIGSGGKILQEQEIAMRRLLCQCGPSIPMVGRR